MNDGSKVLVWKMFFVTAIIGIVALALVIVAVPKDYSFTIKMDDNSLEAVKYLNESFNFKVEKQVKIISIGNCVINELVFVNDTYKFNPPCNLTKIEITNT